MPSSKSDSALYQLQARAPDESTRIEIFDGNMRPVAIKQNLGEVSVQVPAGLYSVRFYNGRSFTEKLAAVMPETPEAVVSLSADEQPAFTTAAPLPGAATPMKEQFAVARDLSRSPALAPPPGHTGGSRLFLFLRNPYAENELPAGITVRDLTGNLLLDLDAQGEEDPQRTWLGAHVLLDPGAYRLRIPIEGGSFVEQIFFNCPDWQTQIFLLASEAEARPQDIARLSILMARSEAAYVPDQPDMMWTEAALRALGRKGNIPGAIQREMFWAKFDNPMLGIYAGLLQLRRTEIDAALLREVFANLCRLVGPLPDVLAIGWALALRDEPVRSDAQFMAGLRAFGACDTPPMLRESWEHLLRASVEERKLISRGSIADRIGGRLIGGTPWVSWLGELPAADPEGEQPLDFSEAIAPTGLSRGGMQLLSKVFDRFLGGLFAKAKAATLHAGLPGLADFLRGSADSRYWLATPRFSDLERSVAYWLQPPLDLRLAGIFESDPQLAQRLSAESRERANDETALLTELNISSTTALRTTWRLFDKLFVRPVLPRLGALNELCKEENQGRDVFSKVLLALGECPSRIHQPQMDRRLNLLEVTYLFYRGSPADDADPPFQLGRVASRLTEARFEFSGRPGISVADLQEEQRSARQEVIARLAAASLPRGFVLPQGWEAQVFPPLDRYAKGTLLPDLVRKDTQTPTKPKITFEEGGLTATA